MELGPNMGALTKMNAGEGNTLIIYIHLYEKLNVKRKKWYGNWAKSGRRFCITIRLCFHPTWHDPTRCSVFAWSLFSSTHFRSCWQKMIDKFWGSRKQICYIFQCKESMSYFQYKTQIMHVAFSFWTRIQILKGKL